MIDAAQAWLKNGAERSSFGANDLETILAQALPKLSWHAVQGLAVLQRAAVSADAFAADGRPEPGDIALFHNRVDANGNGEIDDWLTGCGIVVDNRGRRFQAVVRTGHGPRLVVVWPDGPSQRKVDGVLVNSFLRVPHPSDPAGTPYLAGDLYAGYIDIERLGRSAGSN